MLLYKAKKEGEFHMKKLLITILFLTTLLVPVNTLAYSMEPSLSHNIPTRVDYDVYYGYLISNGNEDYEYGNIKKSRDYLAMNKDSYIFYQGLSRYKDIEKIAITLKDAMKKDITIKITYTADKINKVEKVLKKGEKQIIFDIPKDTFRDLKISVYGSDLLEIIRLDKVELLTKHGNILTNQDVSVYLLGNNYKNVKIYSENTEDIVSVNSLSKNEKIKITGIDKEIPSVKIKATKKDSKKEVKSTTWSNKGLNFSFYDLTSGFSGATIYYCQDVNNTCIPKTVYKKKLTSYNILNGTYYIRYQVVSNSKAKSSIYSFEANVESKTPEAEIEVLKENSKLYIKNDEWSNEDVSFRIYEISSMKGATVYYCEDENNTCTPNIEVVDMELTKKERNNGISYIRYYIENKSGLKSSIKSFKLKIDKEVPKVDLKVTNSKDEEIEKIDSWQDDNLSYKFVDVSKSISKRTIKYCKDLNNTCVPNMEVSSNRLINIFNQEEGIYYIRYRIDNESMLSSEIFSYEAKIDKEPGKINLVAKNDEGIIESDTWTNKGLIFEFNLINRFSKSKIYYCEDKDNTCIPNTEIEENKIINDYIDERGIYYIRYRIVNEANVMSEIYSYIAKVDEQTPDVDIIVTNDDKEVVEDDTWQISAVDFEFVLKNKALSNTTIYSCIDKENMCTPDIEVMQNNKESIDKEGIYYIRYFAKNDSNIKSPIKTFKVKIDITTPICVITKNKNELTNEDIKLTINVSNVGISKINSYSWDGIKYNSNNEKIIKENQHIDAYIKNNAGNIAKCSIEVDNIDKEKPVCELVAVGDKNDDEYVDEVTIKFNKASDNYEIDSYGLNKYDGAKEIKYNKNSDTTITYRGYIKDKAGNTNTCDISLKKNSKLIVEYDNNGGSLCSSKEVNYNGDYGNLCTPVRTGYTFLGWYLENKKIESNTKVEQTKNHTLTAKWSINKYSITYDVESCSKTTKNYKEEWGRLCTPTRNGYTFAGWYKEVNNKRILINETTTVTGNINAYAKWVKEGYTITFDNAGGYGCDKQIGEKDESIGNLCIPKKDNSTFLGWYISDKQINENYILKENIKFHAKWKND